MRILFVCTGNICRSPTAEAVMRKLVDDAGLADEFVIDSAGTGSWHDGDAPHALATDVAAAHGYVLDGHARGVQPGELVDWDVVVGLDRSHVRELRDMAPDLDSRLKVRLLLDGAEVPDPYYGSRADFERTFELIEQGCRELLAQLLNA
jgi:protein-tyrosine phosphatase